eukprot:PhF_6_TR16987/c0_g1_i1/m.25694
MMNVKEVVVDPKDQPAAPPKPLRHKTYQRPPASVAGSCLFVAHGPTDRSPVCFQRSGSEDEFGLHVTNTGIWGCEDEKDQIKLSDLVRWELLDRGNQGEVLLVEHKSTLVKYAVKRIDLFLLLGQNAVAKATEKKTLQANVQRELSMLHAQHGSNHIVKVINAYYDEPKLLILMEYADYSLTKVCRKLGQNTPDVLESAVAKHFQKLFSNMNQAPKQASQQPPDPNLKSIGAAGRSKSFENSGTFSGSFHEPTTPNRIAPGTPGSGGTKKKGGAKTPSTPDFTSSQLQRVEHVSGLPEQVVACIALQLVLGLRDLQNIAAPNGRRGLIHKDIKPNNVLVTKQGKVMIADFGCCVWADERGNAPMTPVQNIGTQEYMGPERLRLTSLLTTQDASSPDNTFGFRSDLWSLGVTLLEIAIGCHPLKHVFTEGYDYFTVMEKMTYENMLKPDFMSREFNDFLQSCLHTDPHKRATPDELLKSDFLAPIVDAKMDVVQKSLANYIDMMMTYEVQEQRASIQKRLTANITIAPVNKWTVKKTWNTSKGGQANPEDFPAL